MHDVYIWRLSQDECVASAHIVLSPLSCGAQDNVNSKDEKGIESISVLSQSANDVLRRLSEAVRQRLGQHGIHSMTFQLEDYWTNETGNDGVDSKRCSTESLSCGQGL